MVFNNIVWSVGMLRDRRTIEACDQDDIAIDREVIGIVLLNTDLAHGRAIISPYSGFPDHQASGLGGRVLSGLACSRATADC